MVINIIGCESANLNIDFIISLLFLLGVVCSVISISEGQLISVHESTEAAEARWLSEKIIQSVELTYSGGEGHELKIEMPANLKGSNYTVEVNQSGVLVKVGSRRGYSFSYIKKISNYAMNEFKVIMYPKKTYILRNIKDSNNCHRIIIFEQT